MCWVGNFVGEKVGEGIKVALFDLQGYSGYSSQQLVKK